MAASQTQDEEWTIHGDVIVARRPFGFGYIYWATGSWEQLLRLGFCEGVELPAPPKRVLFNHNEPGKDEWRIKAVRGRRWELTRWIHNGVFQPIEDATGGRIVRPPERGHLRLVWSADWVART